MKNYITRLYAKDIGAFDELNISFNPEFNFLVGPNGCGKTSILKAIALALNPSAAQSFRYREHSTVWFEARVGFINYRVGFGEGWVTNGEEYRSAHQQSWKSPPSDDSIRGVTVINVENEKINITPLILGAYRRIEYKKISGMQREQGVIEQRKNYHSTGFSRLEGTNLPNVKQWMINRYYEMDKNWATVYKQNWTWVIEKLTELAPSNVDLAFKEIKRDLEPMFTINKESDCYLEEVSAGFQAVLSLVFAIVEWIEGVNEENESYIPNATGTVVIDELDVHLHPEWQLTIRNSLRTIFPRLQFIVTTHSPHMIASAQSGELIVLPTLNGQANVEPINQTYAGWSTDEILEDVMGVKSLENKEYTKVINKALDYVKRKDNVMLERTIEELRTIVHPSNTILQVLQAELAKLQLKEFYDQDQ